MNNKIPIIIITGPTASGKSDIAIRLAQRFDGEIISVDSMQIYKGMDIGTGKVLPHDYQGIPHHMLDIKEPEEEFSVAEYVRTARELIKEIHSRNKVPFLVGGTTLYLGSIIDNIQFFELDSNVTIREELEAFCVTNGNEALWQKLNEIDPDLASSLHPNNKGRIIRGIEVFRTTGKTMTYWQEQSRSVPSPYDHLLIGISYQNRETLYERINKRVDLMVEQGLLEEIEKLKKKQLSKTAYQAIGYKELWDFKGEEELKLALERLKQETRRYAKRQQTWMRNRKDLLWINKDEFLSEDEYINNIYLRIQKFLNNQVVL